MLKQKKARPYKLFRFPYGDKGGGKEFLEPYSSKEQEKVLSLQSILQKEGFQRAHFEGVSYPWFKKARLDEYIDAPWTLDAKEYMTIWEKTQKSSGLRTLDDVLARPQIDDPENELGLHYPHSSEIILLHNFKETSPMFKPIVDHICSYNLTFCLPTIE